MCIHYVYPVLNGGHMNMGIPERPRPVYLKEAHVKATDEIGPTSVVGKVLFPSEDPSIGDREDHVNVSHMLFALWNAVHFALQTSKIERPLATRTEVEVHRVVRPDKEVILEVEVLRRACTDKGTVSGQILARFLTDARLLATARVDFVAHLKR